MKGHHKLPRGGRICAIGCALAMLLTMNLSTGHVTAASVGDLKDKYNDLEQQQQQIQQQLDDAKDEKDRQLELKQQLDAQISLTREQIETLDQRLELLNSQIEEKETQIQEKETEIQDNMGLFEQRLRSMQVNNTSTQLGLLFGSDSFADFLSRAESLNRITQHDRDLVDKLVADRQSILDAKASIEENRQEVQENRSQAQQKQEQLDAQLSEAQRQIQSIDQLEKDYQEHQEQIESDMKDVQSEIDRIYSQNQSSGTYVGGEFTWPVPGYSSITSYYGWRFNNTDFHTGIDISGGGIYGKNIVAANSGTVIKANTTYTPGVGYGIYLIIDHGGGMSTLYGHTSQLYVKQGDHVEKGQVIAAVGSTGWSTGPHLHFEIRQNGQHTNPLNWFQKQ